MKPLRFQHHIIDATPAGTCNDVTLIADINGDGFGDIIIGGKFGPGEGNPPATGNLVWYEYPTWQRHVIGCGELEAGGVIADLTGNGRPDIIAGEQGRGRNLYWWEHPGDDPAQRWTRRLITDCFERYHDQAIGDIDDDGEDELVVLSQNVKKLVYFDIPDNPRVEPWPDECCHVIADDVHLEGVRVVDIDGDGRNEILAGNCIFTPGSDPTGAWQRRALIEPFAQARTAVGDLNGDGFLDTVLSEGESKVARLLWLEGPDFTVAHELRNDLFNPHSLEVADFDGSGTLDIFCGEMHLGQENEPRILIFRNRGDGTFEEQVIPCPEGIHEGKLADIGNAGRPSIIGKPYSPYNKVEWWENLGPR
jgi:hypothetical protein